jgi:uncharacterized membrane protein
MNKANIDKYVGKTIAFDLDLTLTITDNGDWQNRTLNDNKKLLSLVRPNLEMIAYLNRLSRFNTVYIFTARSDILRKMTETWLRKYEVDYDFLVFNKPTYDCLIDDLAVNANDLLKEIDNER